MKIERWVWYSIAVNILLALLHGFIDFRSDSLAVAAELTHNIVDLAAAVAVLIGLKLTGRKSKSFPYGLYKVENLVAAGLAALIFLTAYEIARDALLATTALVRVENWMLAALTATAALPLVFSRFELRAGKSANSPALIADAREYRVHGFTTGLAFAALLSERFRYPLDRLAALVIVVAVLKTRWDLLRDAMRVLLDASLDAETLARIRNVIHAEAAVAEVKWVTGRNAGRFRFVEAGVAARRRVDKAELVMRRIETSVRAALPRRAGFSSRRSSCLLMSAMPYRNRPCRNGERHFGEAPFSRSAARSDGAIESRSSQQSSLRGRKSQRHSGGRMAVAQKIDVVLSREDVSRKGPAYVLREACVELRVTDRQTVGEAILPAV
jgi:cation diffusion facilitator family transporter